MIDFVAVCIDHGRGDVFPTSCDVLYFILINHSVAEWIPSGCAIMVAQAYTYVLISFYTYYI